MPMPNQDGETPPPRPLQDLPGIEDVVWAALARLDGARACARVVFVSPESRAGTTVIAAATAIGIARHLRTQVCLVEANVEHPALAGYLGLRTRGLTDVLDGRAELDACIQEPRDCGGLYVLPAGTPRKPVPGEFTTERMQSILGKLAERSRYVILDAAPILDHIESRLLMNGAAGAILVLRARATRRDDAERAHRVLLEAGAPVLGSIFNAYRPEHPLGVRLWPGG